MNVVAQSNGILQAKTLQYYGASMKIVINNPVKNGQRSENFQIVEWSIELMHQTEAKSLSVLGFYMALASVLIGFFLLEERPVWQANVDDPFGVLQRFDHR